MGRAGTGHKQAKWQVRGLRGREGQQEVDRAAAEGPTGRLAREARAWREKARVCMAPRWGWTPPECLPTQGTWGAPRCLPNVEKKTQIPRVQVS